MVCALLHELGVGVSQTGDNHRIVINKRRLLVRIYQFL